MAGLFSYNDRTAHWVTGPLHRRLEGLPRTCEKPHRIWVQHWGLVNGTRLPSPGSALNSSPAG